MNIPALIEVDIKEEWNGKGGGCRRLHRNILHWSGWNETLKKMQEKKEEDIKARELLQELKGKEDITVDGNMSNYMQISAV